MKALAKVCFMAMLLTLWACGDSENDDPGGGTEEPGIAIPTGGATSPTSYDGMRMIWEDDFSGAELNSSNWSHEMGTGSNGWGNNELQYYQPQNTTLQDGHLIISAREQSIGGSNYSSSRIISQNKFDFTYGRVDIRAALPQGQGIWPALWMLGSNFSTVGWPACGEIDIMEKVGGSGRENTIHGTVHWQNEGQHAEFGGSVNLSTNTTSQFHVYSIVWTETRIVWYVDDEQYHAIDTSPGELSEFRRSFFFIMNLAVGGNWPGAPNASTSFPQHMIVDYIRVFQQD